MLVFPLYREREWRERKGRMEGERERDRNMTIRSGLIVWKEYKVISTIERLINRVKIPPFSVPFKLL